MKLLAHAVTMHRPLRGMSLRWTLLGAYAKPAVVVASNELHEFAYVVSHDLQAPLRAIIGFTDLLLEDEIPLTEEQARWFALIKDSSAKMQRQIDGLLSLSRVQTHAAEPELCQADELLAEALVTLRTRVEERGAHIAYEALPALRGDQNQLTSVFIELISNALVYNESTPEIRVWATRDADTWVIRIEDNGIGIPDRHAEDVFGVFRRLHASDEYEGAGVGLTVCRRIIERHGGKIWVESREGGCTLAFRLAAVD